MRRQFAHRHGLHAIVHQTRHLHRRPLWQIADQSCVRDIAIKIARNPPVSMLWMMPDPYSWLRRTLIFESGSSISTRIRSHPGNLHLAATNVLVQRNVKFLQQFRTVTLDEPGHILGKMLTGLGDQVAQPLEHLIAHTVPLWRIATSGRSAFLSPSPVSIFAEYVPWLIKRDRPELLEEFNIPLDEYIRRCEVQIAG